MRCHKFYNCHNTGLLRIFLDLKYLFVLVFTPCCIVSMNVKYCLKSFCADYVLFHLFEYLVCLVYYNIHVPTFSGNRKFPFIRFVAQYFMVFVCFWSYYILCVFTLTIYHFSVQYWFMLYTATLTGRCLMYTRLLSTYFPGELVHIMSQINPVHAIPFYLFRIHFRIILASTKGLTNILYTWS